MKLSARHLRSRDLPRTPNKAGLVFNGPVIDLFGTSAQINDALRDLQNKLLAFVQQLAGIYRSEGIAKARILEHCADPRTQKIIDIILKGKRGRPRLKKPNARLAAEILLTNRTIYENSEAAKKVTIADFAEWYLPSELCPKAQRRKLPLKEADIETLRKRLTRAQTLVKTF